MADARPTLAFVHDGLQQVERCVLEIIARAQLMGAPAATLPLAVLNSIAQPIVKAVMDLETLQQP